MSPENLLAVAMLVCATVFMLSAGAGHGGGILYLFAMGNRVAEQRRAIVRAAPVILELNHLWLAVVVLLLLLGFPAAFDTISGSLAIPLIALLLSTLVKVASFTFPSPESGGGGASIVWRRVSGGSSIIALFSIGAMIGAIASGEVLMNEETGRPVHGDIAPWLDVFPISVGLFTIALGAFLAAVYLIPDVNGDRELEEVFRSKALKLAGAVAILAFACFMMSHQGAPLVREGLGRSWWSLPFHIVTGVFAAGTIGSLWYRRYRLARMLVMGQLLFIIWGWALSQEPYLVVPVHTTFNSAAPPGILRPVLIGTAIFLVIALPAFWQLYVVRRKKMKDER